MHSKSAKKKPDSLQRIRNLVPKERLWMLVVDAVVQQESSAIPCVLLETSGLFVPGRQLKQAFKLSKAFVRSLSCYFKNCLAKRLQRILQKVPPSFYRSRQVLEALQRCPCCFRAPVAAGVWCVPLLGDQDIHHLL